MAKNTFKYAYPSYFGSHKSMIDQEATKSLSDPAKVVCVDEYGAYTTLRNRLDDGMADMYRYNEVRMGDVLGRKAGEKN